MEQPPTQRFPYPGVVIQSDYEAASYHVERILGQGATAVACLVTRRSAAGESPAVLKVILPQMVTRSGDTATKLILKEAVALGRLNERVPPTPFVVRLIEAGATRVPYLGRTVELPWLALEYVHGGIEGTTLEDRVEHCVSSTGHAFGAERAARLVQHLALGLAEVHAVGVIHRDLNPNNVLCCGTGDTELFKLSDFGIARPHGIGVTFGTNVLVGTPGYLAPEQAAPTLGEVGFASDLFSLGAIVYFVLTGTHYFDVTTVAGVFESARLPERPQLLAAQHLPVEFRECPAACATIDQAIVRATAFSAAHRSSSPAELAATVLPALERVAQQRRGRARSELVAVVERADSIPSGRGQRWTVRHPPGGQRLITGAAWNAAGHCLAATTEGICYWDGSAWLGASQTGLPQTNVIRFVRRLGASSWLVGGEGATLAEISLEGTRVLPKGRDPEACFLDAYGSIDDVMVVIAQTREVLCLYGVVAGHWLKALSVPEAATLTSVAQIDATRWLVVGRDRRGRGLAAIHKPLDWSIESLELPPTRALLAANGHPDRSEAAAVGTGGLVVLVGGDRVETTLIDGAPDLTASAMDIKGRPWVASAGRLWTRESDGVWTPTWGDPGWTTPVVSIMAELGFVAALTVDGGVVEYHTMPEIPSQSGLPSY